MKPVSVAKSASPPRNRNSFNHSLKRKKQPPHRPPRNKPVNTRIYAKIPTTQFPSMSTWENFSNEINNGEKTLKRVLSWGRMREVGVRRELIFSKYYFQLLEDFCRLNRIAQAFLTSPHHVTIIKYCQLVAMASYKQAINSSRNFASTARKILAFVPKLKTEKLRQSNPKTL